MIGKRFFPFKMVFYQGTFLYFRRCDCIIKFRGKTEERHILLDGFDNLNFIIFQNSVLGDNSGIIFQNSMPGDNSGIIFQNSMPGDNSGIIFQNSVPGDNSGIIFQNSMPGDNSGIIFQNSVPGDNSGPVASQNSEQKL